MQPRQIEQKTGVRRRSYTWTLWPMRLVVLVGACLLFYQVLLPLLPGGGSVGAYALRFVCGGLLAAAAVCVEVWLTAKAKRTSMARIAGWRLVVFDRLASGADALANGPRQPAAEFEGPDASPPAFGELPQGDEPAEPARRYAYADDEDVIEGVAVEVQDDEDEEAPQLH